MKSIKILIAGVIALCMLVLSGCHHEPEHPYTHMNDGNMSSYYGQNQNGDWLWYYVLLSNSGNNHSTYYYSSPTPVTNFTTVNMNRVEGTRENLPKDFVEQVDKAEYKGSTSIAPSDEPNQVVEEQEKWEEMGLEPNDPNALATEQMNAESSNTSTVVQPSAPTVVEPTEHEAPAEAPSESSSESSSSDSSSGDSGGGE